MKFKFELTFDTDNGTFTVINTETGEVQEATATVKKATKRSSKSKDDGNPIPTITLEDNKYCLNTAAANILIDPSEEENRLDIKYEKQGTQMIPIIGNCNSFGTKGGNKVTKSNTVACRGKAHEELAQYGSVFTLEEHPTKEGIYILKGENTVESLDGDEKVSVPDDDLDLDGLTEDESASQSEVDDFDFTL